MKRIVFYLTVCLFILVTGCAGGETAVSSPIPLPTPTVMAPTATTVPTPTAVSPPVEIPITAIPLTGPAASANAELSGMAWYDDWLILLPQYPTFATSSEDGLLFAIAKTDILAYLDGSQTAPLTPQEIPFLGNLGRELSRFEGFEAITFAGDTAYLTVETSPGKMLGYLVSGSMAPDLSVFTLNMDQVTPIEPQADSRNHTDETILLVGDTIVTIYEVNGRAITPHPVAHRFTTALQPLDTIPFPSIEYRITDATGVDENGRFWAINYFFPGDSSQQPLNEPIAASSGKGTTHAQFNQVERLLEMQLHDASISLTNTPPIQLQLIPDARNWEGIVRLDDRGFLLVTDKFPETILAFVPIP